MRTLIIDRFEGEYAICDVMDGETESISVFDLPEGASEGDVLLRGEDGYIMLDQEATEKRRQSLADKQNSLFDL